MASITRFYALILSTVLLLSGVPGFFPNFASFEPLVTFFALTLVHAVVHAAAGLLGLLISALASDDSVRIYTFGISLLYGILAGVGLIGINFGPVLTFNAADNWLHGGIFVLSLGVVLAGVAEERVHQRSRQISEGLPAGRWAVPSAPVETVDTFPTPATATPFAPRRTSAPSSPLGGGPASASGYPGGMGTYRQPNGTSLPPRDPAGVNPWAPASQTQWGSGQPTPSSPQPPAALWTPSQPADQPRDPWTREQRRPSTPRPTWPAPAPSAPAGGQQPGNPWAPYPSQPYPSRQDQWPQSPPPQSPWPPDSQPPQNPWSRDSEEQRSQPKGGQWPLDEWPSLKE